MLRRVLLVCGIASSALYVGADLLAAVRYPDYHSFTSQAISELTAINAPSRRMIEPLLIAYDLLIIAFGVGVWISSATRRVRLVGNLLMALGLVGLVVVPLAPMHLRGTGSLATDAPHIAVTAVLALVVLLAVGSGASVFGGGFRLYSYVTLLTLLAFGVWTGLDAPRLAAGKPTPWMGAAERVHIGAFLAWVTVLAVVLWRSAPPADSGYRSSPLRR